MRASSTEVGLDIFQYDSEQRPLKDGRFHLGSSAPDVEAPVWNIASPGLRLSSCSDSPTTLADILCAR